MITTYIMADGAPAENRTRGPTMATLDFTTKPLALDSQVLIEIYNSAVSFVHHHHLPKPHKTTKQ